MKVRLKNDPGKVWEVIDVEFEANTFEYLYHIKNGQDFRSVSGMDVIPLYEDYTIWLNQYNNLKETKQPFKLNQYELDVCDSLPKVLRALAEYHSIKETEASASGNELSANKHKARAMELLLRAANIDLNSELE